jgi:MurNAc alpha-1-phosphate uridylyltransferase
MNTRFFPDTILLAAGLGTRMMPLTQNTPKPLILVAGVPLLNRVVSNFSNEGATNFVVNAHYHADQIEASVKGLSKDFDNKSFGLSREDEHLLDSGGGAKKALRLTQSDPVFIANTDAFWHGEDNPLARMRERQQTLVENQKDAIVLLCALPAKSLGFRRSHDFCLNPNGHITLDAGVPVIYSGVALVPRTGFARTPQDAFSMNLIFERAMENKALYGVLLLADWYHVGDPQALLEAEIRLKGS